MMGGAVGMQTSKMKVRKLQDENELLQSASGDDTDLEMQRQQQAAQTRFKYVVVTPSVKLYKLYLSSLKFIYYSSSLSLTLIFIQNGWIPEAALD